jgi:uncharacterized membrane protein
MAMAQDPNSQSQYNQGYSGYTPPQTASNQQYGYGQQSGYQAGDQASGYQEYSGSYQQSAYGQQQQQQQQYGTYQPPQSATRGTGAQGSTSTGLNARNEAVFSYLLGWFSGLIFFFIERKNRFVRFHAAQSFITFGGIFIVYVVLRLLGGIPIIGFLLSPILGVVTFIVLALGFLTWLFLMFQAYRGKNFRLPIVSSYADSLVYRFSPKRKGTI